MNWLIRVASPILLTAVSSAVTAQSEWDGVVEEVVVTAQKREQSLREVPMSLTVLDEEQLAQKGFSRFDDIAFGAANLAITNPSGSRAVQFTIRGITGQTFFAGAESGTGVFIDGVYLNNPPAQNFDLVDVERIEVLRGPQGTLYGKNAIAGAINVITRRPDEETRVSALAEYGNEDHQRLRVGVSGQLADSLFGAIHVGSHQRDGFQKNTFLGSEFDDADSWNLRTALRALLSDELEANLVLDYMREDIVPAALDATPEDRHSAQNREAFEERDVKGAALTLEYALSDAMTLTSISSWREYETTRGNDDDGSIVDAYFTRGMQDTTQFSQELRLTSASGSALEWLLGAYYLESDLQEHSTNNLFPDPLFVLLSGISCTDLFVLQLTQLGFPLDQAQAAAAASCADTIADHRVNHETRTLALFGQASYDFRDRLRLTLGLRSSWEDKDFRIRQPGPGGALFLLPGVDSSFDREDTSIDPMISLSYFGDATNYYATVSRGAKSGGFNTGAVGDASQLANVEFAEEQLLNYEIGLKSRLLDGRLNVNVALFHMDYEDLQVFRIEPNAQGIPVSRITNVAEATSQGVEVDFSWMITELLQVRGSLGYLDAEYEDYSQCGQNSAGVLLDCTGNNLTNAPDRTATVGVDYRLPIGDRFHLQMNGEWSYRGDVFYDVFNSAGAAQDAFSIYNATLTFAPMDERWSVALWGKNLGDEDYITIGVQGFGGIPINTLGAPRQYGIRVSARI